MIVRTQPSIFTLLTSMRGSIVPAITPQIIAAALWGALAAAIRGGFLGSQIDNATFFDFVPFTTLGVAISLFLGFRNNASYDRWVMMASFRRGGGGGR
jgi:putative membrane protein